MQIGDGVVRRCAETHGVAGGWGVGLVHMCLLRYQILGPTNYRYVFHFVVE